MGDDEARREDARIDEAIDRAIRNGTMGECYFCDSLTSSKVEDEDAGTWYWLCRACKLKKCKIGKGEP